MARIRVNVSPKISSHSAGWIARVTSSLRSRRNFCSSTRHIAPVRESTSRAAEIGLTEAASGAASCPDIAESFRTQVVTGVGTEHVVEARRTLAQPGDQLVRRAQGPDPAPVHERDPVAVLLGLLHVV